VQRRGEHEIGPQRGDPLDVEMLEAADARDRGERRRQHGMLFHPGETVAGAEREHAFGTARCQRDDAPGARAERHRAREIVDDEAPGQVSDP
jgi:hypothetical protein